MAPAPPQTLQQKARAQIRRWIASTGITQTALGDRIQRNQAWMSRYLGGDIDADLETLQQMAEVFNHSLISLLQLPADPEEAELIAAYRALRPESRALALTLLKDWSRARTRGRGPSRR
jgi:transcriptional regulator with XRE-family HTH domain